MSEKIKVLIADDHALVREGIAAFLRPCEDIEVVGEASNGKEAIEKTIQLRPDVVLMDISMPVLGGLEATLEIKKVVPETKILILTQYNDTEYVDRLLKAGVSGYILKHAVGTDLVSAIRAVSRDEIYLYPTVASKVVSRYLGKEPPQVRDPYDELTDREKQVLRLIAEGYSYKEIANILSISVKTVITHQTHIAEKLNIHSKAGLIRYAFRKGILK